MTNPNPRPPSDPEMDAIAAMGEQIDPLDGLVNFTRNGIEAEPIEEPAEELAETPPAEAESKSEESDDESEPIEEEEDTTIVDDESDDEKSPLPTEEKPRNLEKALRRITKQKSKVDQLEQKIDDRFGKLEGLLEKFITAKSPEKQEEAKDDVTLYAEKHGLDLDQVKELVTIMDKRREEPKLETKIETIPPPKVEDKTTRNEEVALDDPQSIADFNKEWDSFEENILTEHPTATARQLRDLKQEMYKVSHEAKNVSKNLDTIFGKDEGLQEFLFTPKARSAETGRRTQIESKPHSKVVDDLEADIDSMEDALAAQDAYEDMRTAAPQMLRRDGKNIRMR